MKLLRQGIALAVAGAGLAVVPALQGQATAAEPSLVQQMKQQAQGGVELRANKATGKVGFLAANGGGADLAPGRDATSASQAAAKAATYLDKYGPAFGVTDGELEQAGLTKDKFGWTVSYTQQYQGVDVFGSMLKANIDNDGDLTSVAGFAAPDLSLSTTPRLSAAEAGRKAVDAVRNAPATTEDGAKADLSGIEPRSSELIVYRTGAIKGEAGENVLAYQVEVTNKANIRDMVFIDADTGKPVNRYSMANDALDRELYEATGTAQAPVITKVWEEGNPFPGTLNQDQQNLVNSSGESYWLFKNSFGRDSYDGAGATMKTVNNDPRISCPNANWNGVTTNYCNGVTSDDVVSHEWGHAYTEYTSGLIYQYQPGALNESYSDVWGETLDLINAREDEGEGDITAKRAVGSCDPTAPPALQMVINSPASIAGPCRAVSAPAAAGGGFGTTPVTADVVEALDAADTAGPTTQDGCSTYTNAAAVSGKWAYVDRGTCTFQAKYDIAVAAGATGLVIGNNQPNAVPSSPSVTGSIKAVMVSQEDGTRFKAADAPVNVTVQAEDTSARPATTRWLMGEKSTAFGGAIRDMWNPTCYGDPGKVSDAEYNCDPLLTDAGGVHSNSGVPNHAYALVVDGGTYNGQTVAGLGLDKAAHIWWRAQSAYLTPSSGFADAANALEQSCADLVGQPITKLSTAPDAAPVAATPIAAGDCGSVTAAIAATEMRVPPSKCNFQPMFEQGAPAACGEGFATDTLFEEDFEDGLTGWATSFETVFEGGIHEPWRASTDAPTGNGAAHPGGVAYGPAPDQGECSNGAGDFSSRDSIASPVIELPSSLRAPRLSFDHYVATEAGYDGGNVKVSINGAAYEVIPAGAYTFNAPKEAALQPTNPLGGEDGFTGTDGGEVDGSWAQSQVDLTALDVKAGDTVQFRFDIGRDGCGGIDGWYVDNVQVVQCQLKSKVTAVHLPEPSTYGQASSVKVTVERDGNVGGVPSGEVTLTEDGATVGTGTLVAGSTTIALPADLPVGVHTMTATYSGNATIASSSATVTVTVQAGPGEPGQVDSRTRLEISPKKPRFRQDFVAVARVSAEGGAEVTGRVTFLLDGRRVGRDSVEDGVARLRIDNDLRPGSHTLVAVYGGSTTVDDSRDSVRFTITRR